MGSQDSQDSLDALVGALVDQHLHIRDLVRAVLGTAPDGRTEALARLTRYVAVHEGAERVALSPPGDDPTDAARLERELVAAVERIDDLGADCSSFTVQLGLLAAALVRHTRATEEDVVPRFVAGHDEFDVRWAAAALGAVDRLVADETSAAAVPVGSGFRHQLRAAADAVSEVLRHG